MLVKRSRDAVERERAPLQTLNREKPPLFAVQTLRMVTLPADVERRRV
jgi:hypothetical protein